MRKLTLLLVAMGSACGGGDSTSDDWVALADMCATPRTGTDPLSNQPYPDKPGTLSDEKKFLRAMIDDIYLWYNEVPNIDPNAYPTAVDYFEALRTPALLPSGKMKDPDAFHFTYPTTTWEQIEQSIEAGYGINWALVATSPPRLLLVATVQPGSPAAAAGIARGAEILTIDGVNVVNGTDVDTLNAGISPGPNETHTFSVLDLGAQTPRTVTLVSSGNIQGMPVQNVKTISTPTGLVGYFEFDGFENLSEIELIAAVNQLKTAGITDLVMDLRYNGGGLLAVASELSFMIAGQAATTGKTFQLSHWNNKHPTVDPVTGANISPLPFLSTAVGFSATQNAPLPSLGLTRVFILTTGGTASASEAVINGLRGIDVQVYLFGSTTHGKPYGFYPLDNCGTTYFAIQFQGVNNKGFGDFPDGFTPGGTGPEGVPGCAVADDFTHLLGDPNEHMLAAALAYRANQTCGGITARGKLSSTGVDLSAVNGIVRSREENPDTFKLK